MRIPSTPNRVRLNVFIGSFLVGLIGLAILITPAFSATSTPPDSTSLTRSSLTPTGESVIIGQGMIYDVNSYCDGKKSWKVTSSFCPGTMSPNWTVSIAATGNPYGYTIQNIFNEWSLYSSTDGYYLKSERVYWNFKESGCAGTAHIDVSYVIFCSP